VNVGLARAFLIAVVSCSFATLAAAQGAPPECAGLPANNVIDLTVKPGVFTDLKTIPDGHDKWLLRGQFVPFTSFEIDLGPQLPEDLLKEQQVTVILARTSDDVVLFSKTLGPTDFEPYGASKNKWRHTITDNEAVPGDTWRVSRIRTTRAPNGGFLNRLKFTLEGVFEPPLDLVDEEGLPVPIRFTLKIEPTQTTCAAAPERCLCATYPLACQTPGPRPTLRCFSGA
jgi:hypothetical protein